MPEEELFKICIEYWNWFCQSNMMKLRGHQMFQQAEVPAVAGMDFSQFATQSTQGLAIATFL